MVRLSIIIPLQGSADLMESGLVTVLENRPAHCEVLVVLNADYADPYDLGDEVRFVRASDDAGWVESVNTGVACSRGEFVHLLQCGVQATDGWADRALQHFGDDDVAAVCPLIVHPYKPSRVLAAGLKYGAGGRRITLGGSVRSWKRQPCWPVLGPTRHAAFYRRDCWDTLEGMTDAVGDELADVDFSLRLAALGCRAFLDPTSVVKMLPAAEQTAGFRHGKHAERLFLRNVPAAGWFRSLALHGFSIALEHMTSPRRLASLPSELAGRLAGWGELSHVRAHHAALQSLSQGAAPRDGLRVDGKHAAALRAGGSRAGSARPNTANTYRAKSA